MAVRQNSWQPQQQHLAYICRNTRWLFRTSVWFDVSCLLSSSEAPGTGSTRSACTKHNHVELPVQLDTADAVAALKHTNWNIVERAKQVARGGSSNADDNTVNLRCPVAVVMLSIDASVPHAPEQAWSDRYAKSIMGNGVIYGTVEEHTRIIVQIRYVGLLNSSVPAALKKGAYEAPPLPRDEAIAVLVLDGAGTVYSYNMPEGVCERIALKCVSHLLKMTTAAAAPALSKVFSYRPRNPCDDNLYALYITAACTREEGVGDCARGTGQKRRNNLTICRASARCERPTRIISNLRFLMCLCKTDCAPVLAGLLLDETNTFDEFKRTVLHTGAE